MKRICLLAILCVLAARATASDSIGVPHALSSAERQSRMKEFAQKMNKALDHFLKRIDEPNGTPSIRDLPNAALAALYLGKPPAVAEKLLDIEFAQQDMDPASKNYGSVPWQIGKPEIHDENAIDFACQALGPIFIHYGDKLSADFRKRAEPHFKAAFAALSRRKLPVAYTNIWLMRTVDMILMGQAIGDNVAEDQGYQQLQQWIDYTRQAGIHEFDSPTYYACDLNSLNAGYLYASRPGAKAKFKAILDYFWTDMAANYFPANGVLCGPASRNYSFLDSAGGIDLSLYAEGFRDSEGIGNPDFEKVFVLETSGPQAYHVGPEIFKLATSPSRTILSRYDTAAGHDRYNYLTPEFAIGSASGDYCAHDKLVTVELASAGKLPVIAIIPDVFDSPYGTTKTADRSGHMKPTHVQMRPIAVQDKGAMMVLLDIDGTKPKEISSLATNILLPADAQITLDNHAVNTSALFEQKCNHDCVIGVRAPAGGAAAIRIFTVGSEEGFSPITLLKLDKEGQKNHVARLAAYHYRGDSKKLKSKHILFGVAMLAGRCSNDQALATLVKELSTARIQSVSNKTEWTATAAIGKSTFAIARNLTNGEVISRTVNGTPPETSILSINGDNVGERLLQPLAP